MSAKIALLLSFSVVAGCSTSSFPLADRADDAGLERSVVRTALFEHSIYRKSGDQRYQVVFIEGDGRPWNRIGSAPSADPTPGDALAFELMLATPANALYVTRPCYFDTWIDSCSPDVWTSGRFSADVVASLADAIRAATDPHLPVVIVGYSGGGALAMLVSAELDRIDGVVTVAGLLDIDRWTDHHGYEPLSESINPASRAVDAPRLHLHGALDTVVPIGLARDALAGVDGAELRVFDDFNHVCCWRRDWPRIWEDVETVFDLDGRER